MKSFLYTRFYIVFTLLLLFSSCKKLPTKSDFGTGPCTLEQLEWNTVTEGFDQEKSLKILTDLKAMAQAKQNNIADSVRFNADFTTSFNNVIKSVNKKEFKVSQEVQDLMMKLRRLGCDMQAGIFDGNMKAAQERYLELLSRVDEQKKNLEQQLLK